MFDSETCGRSVSMILKKIGIAWGVGAFLLTITGNIIVLVASLRDKAIKLDRVSVVLIENLAVADISFAFLRILPNVVSFWISCSGETFITHISGFNKIPWTLKLLHDLGGFSYGMGVCLLPALTICKLLSLIFPLRARSMRSRDGYRLALTIWAFMILLSVVLHFYEDDIYLFVVILQFSLFILLIFTTVGLLVTVHRARGLNRQGVFSISLVSVVYILAKTPTITAVVYAVLKIPIPSTLDRIANMSSIVTSFSNPLIYYLTVRSFNEFVKRRLFECSGTSNEPDTTNRTVPNKRQTSLMDIETS